MDMSLVQTHPHPDGVVTPKKQSSDAFTTTWSARIGVMTMPALTSEAQKARAAAASVVGFMVSTCRGSVFLARFLLDSLDSKLAEGAIGRPAKPLKGIEIV